jgi:outer membrane receptor protein involved in Fe transport
MLSTTVKRSLLATTAVAGLSLICAPAWAQEAPTQSSENAQTAPQDAVAAEPTTEGEIVVTGTLVRNPNLVSSSPVSVIGEGELQLRNITNAEQALRDLPGVSPGIGSATNNGQGGFSTVDLRGLGEVRNLVLLDGNRIVTANQLGTVDLNNIPLALVSRVDVLTGGASTTYGADAVSGVVNFVTRRNFSGLELSASNSITERGDGNVLRIEGTIGANFDGGRGNAVLSLGYQEADPVYQGAREVSLFEVSGTTGRGAGSSPTSVPASITINGTRSQLNPTGTALVAEYAGFNFNPFNIFQTPYKRQNLYAAANYEVSDSIEVYARALGSRNVISSIIAPSGIFGEALTVPGNNPFLAAGVRDQLCQSAGIALGAACNNNAAIPLAAVFRRTVEIGPRISEYTTTVYDARAGVRFGITDAISLDISGAHGESDLVQIQSGYVLRSRVQQALNANNTTTCNVTTNGCVPLNLFGPSGSITAAQADFLRGSSTITIKNKLTQARALLSGDFGTALPWASEPIGFAVGAEYRNYGYERLPDNFAANPGELGGAGGAILPFEGGYNVREAYAELIAPIASDRPFFQELTLEAGVRYSAYKVDAPNDPSFNTTTYKFGANWEIVDALKLRGNYQRAVRAPNIDELFRPVATALTNLAEDPCQGTRPVGNANLILACVNQGANPARIGSIPAPSAGQVNFTGGGNTEIRPEKATTYTFGLVLQPRDFVPGFTAAIDYYNIKITNAISRQTPGDAIAACFGTTPASITAAQANSAECRAIRRSPADSSLSGSSASVPGLFLPLTNLGRYKTDGIDLTLNYVNEISEDIGLNLSFIGNWTRSLRFRASPTALNRECVGYFSVNCGPVNGQIQPEYSFQQRTTLSFGPADISLLWRYLHKVRYEPGLPPIFSGTITGAGPLVGRTENFNTIPAYHYFDLTARFEIERNLDFIVGVQNLFDKEAPITGSSVGATGANSGNTFPSSYDTLGRRYNAAVRVRF